jgi:hypothetical protein
MTIKTRIRVGPNTNPPPDWMDPQIAPASTHEQEP